MGSILLLCVLNTFLAAFGFPTTELPDTNSTGHGVTTSKNIALTSSPSLENAMNNSFQILVQNASDIEGRGCPIDLSLDFPISELMEINGFSWKNYSHGSVMLGNCTFNIFKQSFFVIHGWSLVPLPDTWIDSLVAAIFHRHPHSNVFVLNWLDLAQVRYAHAVRRGHQVGRHIAAFIDWLNEHWGYLPKRIHLVGFSLGAHVAGSVGSAVSRGQIGRITGLDPAGPIFETAPPDKSLSPDDALFVDVIHTSIVGPAGINFSMGIQRPVGHQDFYPNGGAYQPGCDWSLAYENVGKYGIMGLAQTLKCGHERAVHIFVDTLRSKYLPPAYPCSSLEEWQRGHCLKCNKSTCPLMGKEVKLNNRARRHAIHHKGLYLQTAASPPFIVYHYKVKSDIFIPYGAPLDSEPFLRISLHGSLNSAQGLPMPLYDDFSSNKSHSWLVHTSTELGDLKSVHLSWDVEDNILWKTWLAFSSYIIGDEDIGEGEKPQIMARKVHVKSGESGHRWQFCTDDSDWVIMKRFNKEKFDICHPDPAPKEFQPSNETRPKNLASFTRPSLWLLLFVPLSTLLTIFTSH